MGFSDGNVNMSLFVGKDRKNPDKQSVVEGGRP